MANPNQQKPPENADALARAEKERADKAEKRASELEKKLEQVTKQSGEKPAGAAAAVKDDEPTFKNKRGQVVPERFRGTRTYRSSQPYYRDGVLYSPGTPFTITDERPGKAWVEVKPKAATELAPVTPATENKPQRAADAEV